MLPPLRSYQRTILDAVLESIDHHRGLTFTVEVARQGGKNELSARLEALMLIEHLALGGAGVKCAPTFAPQCGISIDRLKSRLDAYNLRWSLERGHILRLGRARQSFLSAARDANVLGATADLLLEVDEAQDVDKDKYQKEFRPMASTANATTVLYGTPWDNPPCWKSRSRSTSTSKRRMASSATSATTGRPSPNATRPTGPS